MQRTYSSVEVTYCNIILMISKMSVMNSIRMKNLDNHSAYMALKLELLSIPQLEELSLNQEVI